MKRLALFAVVLLSLTTFGAGEDRQCSITFTNAVAGTTAAPTAGTCSWQPGAVLLMQCDQDVYFSQTGTATSTDFQVKFTSNSDPYLIYLGPNQKVVTFLGVSASGTCKFGASAVRRGVK